MTTTFNRAAWLKTLRHTCEHCGRDYRDEPLVPNELCSDDCPTNNELNQPARS